VTGPIDSPVTTYNNTARGTTALMNTGHFIIKFLALPLLLMLSQIFGTSAQTPTVEHNPTDLRAGFSALLGAHINDGFVDYSGFQNSPAFDAYVNYIAENVDIDSSTLEEKLAFYINAYNALAIKGIIDGKSPSSFFGRIKYFYTTKYIIAGKKTNLYDFEHKVIRRLGDARIHFALVCASTSCPKLRSEAFTPEKLDKQLTENAKRFINDNTKNNFDTAKRLAGISKIFDWFEEDFTQDMSLQQYIAQFVSDDEIKKMLSQNEFKVKHNKYDWSLNGNK